MKTSFEEGFQRLTGFSPMHRRSRLFERSVVNDLPNARRNFMLLGRKKWGMPAETEAGLRPWPVR